MNKDKKFIYVQDGGTYKHDILVAVGCSVDDIIKHAKKEKARKEITDELVADRDKLIETMNGANGFFTRLDSRLGIIWLREFMDDWTVYEVLIHELHHAVHIILGEENWQQSEREALAYQQEYWFHNIRQKLYQHFCLKKKTNKKHRKKLTKKI